MGPLQYEEAQGETFLGYSQTQRHNMSNETALLIDAEIRRLVDGGHARATEIIKSNVDQLHQLAGALLELETLTGDEIKTIIGGGKIDRAADVPAVLPTRGLVDPQVEAAQARHRRTGVRRGLSRRSIGVNPRSAQCRAGRIFYAFHFMIAAVAVLVPAAASAQSMNAEAFFQRATKLKAQGADGDVLRRRDQDVDEGRPGLGPGRRRRATRPTRRPVDRTALLPAAGPQKMDSDEYMKRLAAHPAGRAPPDRHDRGDDPDHGRQISLPLTANSRSRRSTIRNNVATMKAKMTSSDRPEQRAEPSQLIGAAQLPVHVDRRHEEQERGDARSSRPTPAARRRSPASS